MPKVSVIIPVFNGASFVSRAIESVLSQTLPDLELIVVDDGSTDESPQVIRSFRDPRVLYLRQDNQGPNAAYNTGIYRARGDLLAFLDSDDWWLPRKLEAQLNRLQTAPEAGLVYCSTLKVDPNGDLLKTRHADTEGQVLERLLMNNDIAGPSSVVVPEGVVEKVGAFDGSLRRSGDWEMWLRIAAEFPIAAVREPLVCITNRSHSHGKDIAASRDDSLRMLNRAFVSYASRKMHLQAKAFARVHFLAGVRYGTLGALRDSRREFFESLRLEPTHLSAYWRLALACLGPTFNSWGRRAKEAIRLRVLRWGAGQGGRRDA